MRRRENRNRKEENQELERAPHFPQQQAFQKSTILVAPQPDKRVDSSAGSKNTSIVA
jgi:hypothetical protein